jgi:predicted transcriptional regulator
MTLAIELPEHLQRQLEENAMTQGVSVEEVALEMLKRDLLIERREQLSARLKAWMQPDEADAKEQQETAEVLIQGLDENRSSYGQHFSTELKGKTW